MKYNKPEVKTLGDSKKVIEQINPSKPAGSPDGALHNKVAPAYDLDE